jgi:uncharacterized protein YjlB
MHENTVMVDKTREIKKGKEEELEELRKRIKELPEITIEPAPPE